MLAVVVAAAASSSQLSCVQVRAYAKRIITDVLVRVGDMTPCVAEYKGEGVAVERPDDALLCLQEYRAHKCHRTSRRIQGGSGLWGKLSGFLPYDTCSRVMRRRRAVEA